MNFDRIPINCGVPVSSRNESSMSYAIKFDSSTFETSLKSYDEAIYECLSCRDCETICTSQGALILRQTSFCLLSRSEMKTSYVTLQGCSMIINR
jgi:ferredoxin